VHIGEEEMLPLSDEQMQAINQANVLKTCLILTIILSFSSKSSFVSKKHQRHPQRGEIGNTCRGFA
jgi:hypothetical protein